MKISYKWVLVFLYIICIFIITPYLPQVIQAASSRWSSPAVSRFVLWVEIGLALLILALALGFLLYRKKIYSLFFISVGGIFLLSFIIYRFIPNPYEFTHLPEYAVLSMLIIWALNKRKTKHKEAFERRVYKFKAIRNPYFLSAYITGVIGTIDEIYQHILPNRYFTVYDIFLNILGGILGLLIFWGIQKNKYTARA